MSLKFYIKYFFYISLLLLKFLNSFSCEKPSYLTEIQFSFVYLQHLYIKAITVQ